MEQTRKDQPSKLAFQRIRQLEAQFLRPHRRTILLALLGMFLQSLLLLPIPLLQGWVIDQLLAPEARAWETIAKAVVLGLVGSSICYLCRTTLAWKASTAMSRMSLEVIRNVTNELHSKFQRLPVAYYDREQTGRLMARITNDVGSLLLFLNGSSLQLVSDLVLAVGIAIALLAMQWRLALVSFLALPLYVFNHRFFSRRMRQFSLSIRAHVASLYALLSERLSAVRIVRSFAQEEAEIKEMDHKLDAHRALSWANMRAGAWQGAAATIISGLGTIATLAYGCILVDQGRLSIGELLASYALLAQLYNPLVRLTSFHNTVAATLIAVERISEALEEPETLTEPPDAVPLRRPRGALGFNGVTFSYRPEALPVLRDIELDIRPGMKVGILGPSGSGKSTLLSLVPRLYEVPAGLPGVTFDGVDVRRLRLADLRQAAALVPQQALLFDGTIRSNLVYARPGASEAIVKRALEVADLAAMVDALPQGLETPIGERGLSLSGGQRQRLALARALIADPAVLLLDDCTSALDAETESRIQDALEDLLPGRTCLIVSHKVSSVRRADWIVMLQGGRIVEQGTPADLVAQGGHYAELISMQTRVLSFS